MSKKDIKDIKQGVIANVTDVKIMTDSEALRLKKENERLKETVEEQKDTIKAQTQKIEEIRNTVSVLFNNRAQSDIEPSEKPIYPEDAVNAFFEKNKNKR